MKTKHYLKKLLLAFLLSTALSGSAIAQRSPIADYLANYYEMLNNYGDASLPDSDRQLLREEILVQYFLFEESLVWNDLRPKGSRYIKPREYLDNILTDFPEGITFSDSLLWFGDLQPSENGLKTVVRLRVTVIPAGGQPITNDLSIVLAVQMYSKSSISARIKSIDKAPSGSAPVTNEPEKGPSEEEVELLAWASAVGRDNISGYEAYLQKHPDGINTAIAQSRLEELRDSLAWSEAERLDDIPGYEGYLEEYPSGENSTTAQIRLDNLRENAAWSEAERVGSEDSYELFLSDYPEGAHAMEARRKLEELRKPSIPSVILDLERSMVRVEGGSFTMGCFSGQSNCDRNEEPAHRVELGGFRVGKYEVTQAQWWAVMGTSIYQQRDKVNENMDLRGVGPNYPMYYVSWEEVQEFIRKLNQMTGGSYRLPTEAEWEYAARGGSRSRGYQYSGSSDLDSVGWYGDNSGRKTHPVGGKYANELGLFDMTGNVFEWCADWYKGKYYSNLPLQNPKGPSSGSRRVRRGGSWNDRAGDCRASNRGSSSLGNRFNYLGFRLASAP
ncbi:MAG: formylglycine-generating enzyme family protein [Phaeodactylibacter sp.]|uniref:formylglycine-generating enzyme family protein n=1 Tax=Phaeodactylibacter sp. TaxID=1940289 RepID=UPI0032ED6451